MLRGASQNASMAELLGVNTKAMMTGLFAASAGIAALVGGLAGPIFSVRPGMDLDFLIDAFLAVVIGGLGSVRGAIVGRLPRRAAANLALTFHDRRRRHGGVVRGGDRDPARPAVRDLPRGKGGP